MEKRPSPYFGLSFLQWNNTILDRRQGVLNFLFSRYKEKQRITSSPMSWNPSALERMSQLYEHTTVTGIHQPSNTLTDDGDIAFCAALVNLTNGRVEVHLNNFTDSPYTLKRGTQVANFTVLTPEQMEYVKPVDPVTS